METNSLSDFLATLGLTPERFQAFASESGAVNSRYHIRVVRFEAAIRFFVDDPIDSKSEFIVALAEVLSAFVAWRKEQNHA